MKKFKDSGDYRSGRDRRRLRKHFWMSELLLCVCYLLAAFLLIPFGSVYENQEEALRLLRALSEKYGLTGTNYLGLLKLSQDIKIDLESVVRILGGLQAINPEERKRIRYLYALKLGKVSAKVPRSILDLVIIPPEPLTIEGRKCSLLIHIDALEHKLIAYFAINYKDFLTEHIEYPHYDGAIDRPRKYLNEFFVNFTRVKDKSMGLVESELSMEVRYDEECPKKYRVFEMEMIEIETETLRYGLKYANGRVLKSVGNIPLRDIIRILRREKVWE